MRQQSAFRIKQGKITLVFLHCGYQHFCGQIQEATVELTTDHGRVFNQRGDFVEQPGVDANFATETQRRLLYQLANTIAPLVEAGNHHPLCQQQLLVIAGVGKLQFTGRMKSMPVTTVT